MPVQLDVLHKVASNVFKFFFAKWGEIDAQACDGLWEQIIDRIVALGIQLMEEQLHLIPDPVVLILQHHAYVHYLALELHNTVEDKVSDHHKGLLAHVRIWIMQ